MNRNRRRPFGSFSIRELKLGSGSFLMVTPKTAGGEDEGAGERANDPKALNAEEEEGRIPGSSKGPCLY